MVRARFLGFERSLLPQHSALHGLHPLWLPPSNPDSETRQSSLFKTLVKTSVDSREEAVAHKVSPSPHPGVTALVAAAPFGGYL